METSEGSCATSPLTERDGELWAKPPISAQLPVRFDNGTEFASIEGYCAKCDGAIIDADLRGTVTRLLPAVACVEAVGVCRSCRMLTRFYWRLHDDFRLTGPTRDGWGEWLPKQSMFSRVSRVLRSLLGA